MTKSKNTTTTTTESKGARPTHIAYWVREGKEKASWIRCGAAWTHADGNGVNIALDLQPLDGRIVLRPVPEVKE